MTAPTIKRPENAAGLYLCWDEHMLFSAPLRTSVAVVDATFSDLRTTVLPKLYGSHPDFCRIDWRKVQWFCGDQMFSPRADLTLAQHAIPEGALLRFRTPGLEGVRGSCG